MKLSCRAGDLSRALTHVGKVVPGRRQFPILSAVALTAQDNSLTVRGTDLSAEVVQTIGADVSADGSVAVPASQLAELAALASPAGQLQIATEGALLVVVAPEFVTGLVTANPAELPTIRGDDQDVIGTLAQRGLHDGLSRVMFAMSQDANRPQICGVRFSFDAESLTLVGADGHRVAETILHLQTDRTVEFIVPDRLLGLITAVLAPAEQVQVAISRGNNVIAFSAGSDYVCGKLVDGIYPNYQGVFQANPDDLTHITVDTAPLLLRLRGAAIIANDPSRTVRMQASADELRLKSVSKELGNFDAQIPAEVNGSAFDIRCNATFLVEGILAAASPLVSFTVERPSGRIVVRPKNEVAYRYGLMPIHAEGAPSS